MNLPHPLKVIIVEDHVALRQDLENFLDRQPGFMVIGACGTVNEAIVLMLTTRPDLLLLDIQLPDGTGFDILEKVPPQSKIIFMTAHNDLAIRALSYGAIDYLLKPFEENQLSEALQKVISAQPLLREQIDITVHSFKKNKIQDYIVLRSQQDVQIVRFREISYLQCENGYTTFFLIDGNKLVSSKPLKEYEELLPSTSFFRIHQSYLVNQFYIKRFNKKMKLLYLRDGSQIPVSVRKKEIVDQYFKKL